MSYIVFIQIHSESEKLRVCLRSLFHQTLRPEMVIIVDDGTPDSSVYDKYVLWRNQNYKLKVIYLQAAPPKKPNLDTVGIAIFKAYVKFVGMFEYLSIIDVDSRPERTYYEQIIAKMNNDSDLICASGVIQVRELTEKLISAKLIKRKDARGSGKVIRTDFLAKIPSRFFPDVAWDTWINTKVKQEGKKALQIPEAILYSSRSTTRLANRDNFRDGRLTYHFGYNPLLLFYKIIFRGKGVWKGYQDAKKKKWKLPDEEVRKWFGWRYLFHFWK